MSLDDKLREIQEGLCNSVLNHSEKRFWSIKRKREADVRAIKKSETQIKQAFADEGYIQPKSDGYFVMTGQEAFNRLKQAGLKGKALSTAREALNAEY